jgi:hypothetical protein
MPVVFTGQVDFASTGVQSETVGRVRVRRSEPRTSVHSESGSPTGVRLGSPGPLRSASEQRAQFNAGMIALFVKMRAATSFEKAR